MEFEAGETVYCHDEGISSPLRRGEAYVVHCNHIEHLALRGIDGLYLASRFSRQRPMLTAEQIRDVLRKYRAGLGSESNQAIQLAKSFAAIDICRLLTGTELDDSATLQAG